MRRVIVSIVLAGLLFIAVGSYIQAGRADDASYPGWTEDAGPPPSAAGTPLLSARRVPRWLSEPIAEARLVQRLSAIAASPEVPERTCLAMRRDGVDAVARHSAELLAPSSLMKIVTAAVMLEKAGPAATYATEVFVRADALRAVTEGVLVGDLYLVGRGDPVLSTPTYSRRFAEPVPNTDFTALVSQVADALGQFDVTTVEGGLVADESRFPEEERDYAGYLPGSDEAGVWDPSYVNENAAGPLSALLLNHGYVSFSPSPDPASNRQNVRAADPALHAADVMAAMLGSRGVAVTADSAKGTAPALAERVSLGVVQSPPMAEIVARMLNSDDNTIAEMLLKEIGRRSDGSARSQAVQGVYDVLQRLMGIPAEGIVVSDGSGLSPQNRLTCDLIVDLLTREGPLESVVQQMALAAGSGTLWGCRDVTDAAGTGLWVQGGTRNGMSGLAGVMMAANGDVLTFATISNTDGLAGDLGPCLDLQRRLVEVAAGHPYGRYSAADLLGPLPAATPAGEGG